MTTVTELKATIEKLYNRNYEEAMTKEGLLELWTEAHIENFGNLDLRKKEHLEALVTTLETLEFEREQETVTDTEVKPTPQPMTISAMESRLNEIWGEVYGIPKFNKDFFRQMYTTYSSAANWFDFRKQSFWSQALSVMESKLNQLKDIKEMRDCFEVCYNAMTGDIIEVNGVVHHVEAAFPTQIYTRANNSLKLIAHTYERLICEGATFRF